MMTSPLISIILPTRNRLTTIRRTIERVQAQTFADWELIVSDNASDEEGKAAYLAELGAGDPRVRVHFQETNIGIHGNWRFCIKQTRGRYYIPVTDDDWWGEDHYLQSLLALHDGKTGSVFPNMAIHHLDTGEVVERALTPVYGGVTDRYELCGRLLRDGRGVIMVGLIDMEVVPREEIIAVIDNDLAIAIETVGMHRIARLHPVKFCGEVSYHHSAYSGNYARSHETSQLLQDKGIVHFQLLDEYRSAARRDPAFEPAFRLQWERAIDYCCSIASKEAYNPKAAERADEQKAKLRALRGELNRRRAELSTLSGAIRAWWKQRGSSLENRAEDDERA